MKVGAASRRTALLAAAALLLPFAVFLGDGRYLGSGDTAPAELLPVAVLDHHALNFDAFVQPGETLPYWFRVRNGHVVSDYPVVPGLLNVPVFAAAKAAGLPLFENRFRLSLVTSAALAAGSVLFLFLALRRIGRSDLAAFGFALLYAFGTEVWSVAGKGLFQHGPSLFFLTLALWLMQVEAPSAAAIAALSLGLAIGIRPTNILIAAPLAFREMRRRPRGRAAFLTLLALPVVLVAAHAAASWGDPFTLARNVVPAGFSGSVPGALAGLLLSPARGLFVFSPFLIFAIPAGVAAWRRSGSLFERCLTVAAVLTLAAFSRWRIWWGGHSFGYRILIEIVPLLMLLIAGFWPEIARRRSAAALFAVLAAASIFVQFLGAGFYPSGFNDDIDREPERLWQVRDSEIPLLTARFLGRSGAASATAPEPSRVATPRPHWTRDAAADDMIPGALDWPRPDSSVRGALRVFGWARSPAGPVDVQILISPGDRAVPAARVPRPDVCAALPSLGDCSQAGFEAALEPEPSAAEHLLVVELKGPDGRVRRLGPVRFFWRPAAAGADRIRP
ncbi:MAG TPA: hypothetical protein VMQ61_15060 [Thermoanaerobaculia bacterium]|nr:hypothetical protein [Thermoanaerobaculia bacterium]